MIWGFKRDSSHRSPLSAEIGKLTVTCLLENLYQKAYHDVLRKQKSLRYIIPAQCIGSLVRDKKEELVNKDVKGNQNNYILHVAGTEISADSKHTA